MPNPRSSDQIDGDFGFVWFRFTAGFVWETSQSDKSAVTHQLVPVDRLVTQEYLPLRDNTLLFDRFSRLERSCEAVRGFADSYGWLGLRQYINTLSGREAQWPGERFSDWCEHMNEMLTAVELIDLIHAEDGTTLREFIEWNAEGSAVRFRAKISRKGRISGNVGGPSRHRDEQWYWDEIIADAIHDHVTLSHFKAGDLFGPAKALIASIINRRLYKQVSTGLVLDRAGQLRPYFAPTSLLAAMWLQCYDHVVGARLYRRCEICGKRMDVTEHQTNKKVHDQCSRRERMRRWR
jgi:hypothetical protein